MYVHRMYIILLRESQSTQRTERHDGELGNEASDVTEGGHGFDAGLTQRRSEVAVLSFIILESHFRVTNDDSFRHKLLVQRLDRPKNTRKLQ